MPPRKTVFLLPLLLLAALGIYGRLSLASSKGSAQSSLPTLIPQYSTLSSPPSRAPAISTEERQALEAIQEKCRQEVDGLAQDFQKLPEGAESNDLQLRIAAVKLEGEKEYLRAKVRYALANGRTAEAAQAERILKYLEHPPSAPSFEGEKGRERVKEIPVPGGRP